MIDTTLSTECVSYYGVCTWCVCTFYSYYLGFSFLGGNTSKWDMMGYASRPARSAFIALRGFLFRWDSQEESPKISFRAHPGWRWGGGLVGLGRLTCIHLHLWGERGVCFAFRFRSIRIWICLADWLADALIMPE